MKIKSFEFNLFGENTYLIWDEDSREAAVIDPGMTSASEQQIFDSFVAGEHLILKAILLTHIHVDHTFGVDYVKEHYGIPVYAHKGDEFFGRDRQAQVRMFHLPMELGPLVVDRFIDEGEAVKLGIHTVTALHAPGHSPGSLLYYIPSAGILISGDVLFRGSIGRTDLVGGDYATLISSIHKKILTLPVSTVVYPGHGSATTIADEMRQNPYI